MFWSKPHSLPFNCTSVHSITHSPPNFKHAFYNSVSILIADNMYLHVGPYTATWGASWSLILGKLTLQNHQSPLAPQLGKRHCEPFPIHARILSCFILYRSSAYTLSCCKCLCASAMSCLENTALQQPSKPMALILVPTPLLRWFQSLGGLRTVMYRSHLELRIS